VLLGNGNGTFASGPVTHTVMGSVNSFVVADLADTGTQDLVFAGLSSSYGTPAGVGVCLGNGDGTFQTGTFYQTGTDQFIRQAVVGDFNNDGILDIATVGESGVWLFTGQGGGAFNQGVLIPFTGSGSDFSLVVAADFNSDHNLDLAVTTLTGFVVLFGNGNGTFRPAIPFTTPSVPEVAGSFITADINANGHADIALTGGKDGQILQYFGNGAGTFSKPKPINNVPSDYFTFADVNGDGIPDLVTAYVYVALGKGDGVFATPTFYPVQAGLGTYSVVVADLRNDGRNDIVTDGQAAISVLLNKGKGTYRDGEWVPITGGAGCGVSADFDGDSEPDLAVNNGSGISLLLGTGKASSPFNTGTSIALPGAGCLVTGDLNGDGIPDLLVPTSSNIVVSYLGNGKGTFTEKSTTYVSAEGYVALGDFNHDGIPDFATSANQMAIGNGDGTFQNPTTIVADPPVGGFTNLASGDLNGDGWTDLVLTSSQDSYIYILINDKQGGFTPTIIQSTDFGLWEEPGQVVLDDLNGDGYLDAVVSCSNAVAVFLNSGQGVLTLKQSIPAGGPIAVADVNGDGIPDISVSEGGTVAIFLGNGDGTFAPSIDVGAGPDPGYVLTMNLHGQSPTAGVPDLVLPDLSGGVTVLINITR